MPKVPEVQGIAEQTQEWVSNACRLPGAKHDTPVT